MKTELIMSGIGGQGIMSIGELLCAAAIKQKYEVTFAPFYGQEKRGGRTMCQIVVSDTMGSPIISLADILLVMDERSLMDYEHKLKPGGVLVVNRDMIPRDAGRQDVVVERIPINQLAKQTGNARTANMVALGVVLRHLDFISRDNIEEEIKAMFTGEKSRLSEINIQALELGMGYMATV